MTLGIDIGGSYLRYEIREESLSIERGAMKSSQRGLYAFIESMLEKRGEINTVAVSYAGQIEEGIILSSPHIVIDETDIGTSLLSKYHVSFFIENDVNCAVMAEAKYFGCDTLNALYIGTGMGLGVMEKGRLLRGAKGIATELGHIPYKETPFVCGCGKKNCIELYCSGSALQRWKAYYGITEALCLEKIYQSSTQEVQEIARAFHDALLYAVGITVTLFNPSLLVLGGGIGKRALVYDFVKENLEKYALPLGVHSLEIVRSELENASLEGTFLLKEYHV